MNFELPLRPGDAQREPMSLLDLFAVAALQSGIVQHSLQHTPKPDDRSLGQHISLIAYAIAYAIAARMLQERERLTGPTTTTTKEA